VSSGTPASATSGVPPPITLLDEEALRACAHRLGREIASDHPDGVVLVGVLKGALIFLADLARAISGIDIVVDFIAITRYAPDSGRVRITHDLVTDLTGRDVVIVEDIVDTGLTLGFLVEHLRSRGARRVDVCTLLDRPARRILPLTAQYVGREIPDVFVLGYGQHVADLYRNVPRVVEADRARLVANPEAYVALLYGSSAGPMGPNAAG
jgi:hypoxanthine phosphoribosyltransferase